MPTRSNETAELAALEAGHALVSLQSPLTRLNYFDGKLLRAQDLQVEQRYQRTLVQLSNLGGGTGVVHGYDTELAGAGQLRLGAGLAIDPQGRLLLLSSDVTLPIGALIEASARLTNTSGSEPAKSAGRVVGFADCEPATGSDPAAIPASDLYLVWLAHAEDFCGHDDVYGAICEQACTSSVARRFIVEGVLVLVTPLALPLPPLPAGSVSPGPRHLRSRVASAYFAAEALEPGSLISRSGILGHVWCLGARLGIGHGVPLGVLGRVGSSTTFFDAWTARRERMDAPARRYWAGRLAMRTWSTFLAQLLQFQCQLPGVFRFVDDPTTDDPADKRSVIGEAAVAVRFAREYFAVVSERLAGVGLSADLREALALTKLGDHIATYSALDDKLVEAGKAVSIGERVLIAGGIVETPSGGYLPVDPNANVSVNDQVTRLLGEGVDLRFCVVRPDFIPHALEAVQHMERISLVDGLADPAKKPRVDVLVPDGEIVSVERPATGLGFSVALQIQGLMGNDPQTGASGAVVEFRGVARGETLATGGGVFYLAGAGESVASANVLTNAGGAVLPQAGRASPAPVKPAANTTSTDGALSDESLARILKVASAAKRHTVQRAAERPLPVGETVRTRLDGLSIKEVALEDSSKVFATWFEGRIDRNPMDLELGESTPILGRAVVANPKPQPNVADLTLSGLMFLQNSTETKREKTAQCVIKGLISSRFTTDGRTEVKSTDVEIPVRLVRQRGVANTLRITTPFPFTSNADATMDVNWDDAATVAIEILSKSDRTTTDIDLKLQQDPAVFETSDERHAVAQHGLDVLDAVLDEPTFRDGAERRLFPPADDASKAIVRAHREWVFFHRRHEKECAPPERRAVVEPRRYRAYVTVTTQQLVAQLRKALFENDQGALGRFSFHEVDLVEFEAGSATLRTSQIALLQAFNRVPHGTELIWSGVVNGEAAKSDPSSVVFARLKRVEAALSPVLDPVQKLVSEVLPGVPEPTLTAADAHGVIILVTAEAAATTLRAALVFSEGFDVSSQIKAAEVAFTDNKPEAAPILEFVQRLELPVRQLVLAAKVPDDAAAERLKNVAGIAGLNIPGRNVPQQVIVLTDELASGLPPELLDKVSEVIYFDAATPPAPPPQNLLGLLR